MNDISVYEPDELHDGEKCSVCGGTGWVAKETGKPNDFEFVECEHCDGEGYL